MEASEISILRLHHQRLLQADFQTPSEVVAWLGAMQAQDYFGTLWAIGVRMQNANEATIEQAIADKTIVRTWPMRGTLHFVAPDEIRWILKTLAPRVITRNAALYRRQEIDTALINRCQDLVIAALQGGQQLTRDEMYQILDKNGITSSGRGVHILGYLAQIGLLCLGVRRGKQHTFTLMDEWLPPGRELSYEEALVELARRYFTSRAPATVKDFSWWTGLTLTDAKKGLEAVKPQFVEERINGQSYWFPPSHEPITEKDVVFLLPGFDEFLLSYTDRSASLAPNHKKIWQRDNGLLPATIVIRGEVAGFWKRTLKKDAVIIEPIFLRQFTEAEHHNFAAAVVRYSQFLGLSAVIVQP